MKSPLAQLILACSVCVIAMVAYGFWYVFIGGKSTEVAQLEAEIATKTQNASRLAAARASLSEIAGDEAVIQSYFVSETGVVSFINYLEGLGHSLGSSVSVLSVSTAGRAAQPTLVFSVTVTGPFDAVMRTVGAIEYAPYDLMLSTLAIGADADNSWHADLTLTVGSIASSATSTPSVASSTATTTTP